uniref:Ig-like domain-containing protein n=1 Tax=Elaeophora elaphi TaxID=1147741 RepID=A0A0R3RGV8_9BILA
MPVVKTDLKTHYVPMGRHIILNCPSWNSSGNNYDSQEKKVKWVFRDIQERRSIAIDIANSRFSFNETSSSLTLYTAQKENEGIYDCHVSVTKKVEWVSRVNLYVQDCDEKGDLTSYRNIMNPCLYGGCTIDTFPSAPLLKYLKCNCVLQYTGEYCTELVDGAIEREVLRFSPLVAHICSTLCIIITVFCCRRTEGYKRIVSLEDLAPLPPDISDDPRILYPAAILPAVESQEPIEERELDARTIAICLDQLQHTSI